MKPILIKLDEPTYKSLNHIAPAARRKRAQFIRDAIRKAVREAQYEQIRRAYKKQPDSEAGADDWSTAEEFQP
ncbi:MAG TPA: ribbon-helix-helix protein, CopG family [Bryobacteraceae bacterium]|nr:ribbon-helix-helix protein, CopG family [Bryobacteraceae bacterium]